MSDTETLTTYGDLIDVLEHLPFLVREKRRRCGLSLRACAKEVGMSFSTVTRIEAGEDMVLSNAVALLRWVGDQS